jgi:putative spermidine/putrescine transport system permease protein
METRVTRIALRIWAVLVVIFLYVPVGIILLYAFNASNIEAWPITSLSLRWFGTTWHNSQVTDAFLLSCKAAAIATAIALVLGSVAAFAMARHRFFGQTWISFLLVLPIALPGIVTAIALNTFIGTTGLAFSLWTIVIGHATFCIVVVYNNVVARLRRVPGSLEEASMDLGAHGLQTFWWVTLPQYRTALVAGGLLAFALSFDEVIVTVFTAGSQNTLPLWIFGNFRNATHLPEVNVVAAFMLVVTVIPVYLAQRLTVEEGGSSGL